MKSTIIFLLAITFFVIGILMAHFWYFPESYYAIALILLGGGLYEYAAVVAQREKS